MPVLTEDQKKTRGMLLNGRKRRSELVDYNGVTMEVRQPTVGERGLIFKTAGIVAGDTSKADFAKMQVQAVIACTYFPDSEQRVFDEADVQELLNQPAGGAVDKLANAAMGLLNVTEDHPAKKSQATPSDSSSTTSP